MSTFERVTGLDSALVDLGARGRIRLNGGDRVRFLDGMLTQSIADLDEGGLRPALILDRKGRILSDLEVARTGDALWIETAAGRGPAVLEALDRHLIADDVELTDLAEPWGELGFEGPGAASALAALGIEVPDPGSARTIGEAIWLAGGGATPEGARVLAPREQILELAKRSQLSELSESAIEVLRVEAFRPLFGTDVDTRTFPAEGPFADAVSFTKGCYVGQEIVARIESRGNVHRKLVKLSCERRVSAGDEVRRDGDVVGQVTTAVDSPESGPLALAMLRRAATETPAPLDVAGTPAHVIES